MLVVLLFSGVGAGMASAAFVGFSGLSCWWILPAYSLGGSVGMGAAAALRPLIVGAIQERGSLAPKLTFAATMVLLMLFAEPAMVRLGPVADGGLPERDVLAEQVEDS